MSTARRAGAVGGVLGLVAAGVAVGTAAERYVVGRARLAADPAAGEPFFALPADRSWSVLADDGVPLHVEEVVPGQDGPGRLTVVFCHGYTQQLAAWHYQRRSLAGGPHRLVLWDQRAHGRSGRGDPRRSTIEQLGRDLAVVLDDAVPAGPVVLVGHSMGGMTIMALAAQHPELFGPRVAGVALLGTSAGHLSQLTFGLPAVVAPVAERVLPLLTRGMRLRPDAFERTRRLAGDLAFVAAKRLAFGTSDVGPSLVGFVERMTADCPVDVVAEFYDTFRDHDMLAALDVLRAVPVLVLVGSHDRVTPPEHSRAIAAALPDAELVEVAGAGHMAVLEQPELVSAHLAALLDRALAARRPDRPTRTA